MSRRGLGARPDTVDWRSRSQPRRVVLSLARPKIRPFPAVAPPGHPCPRTAAPSNGGLSAWSCRAPPPLLGRVRSRVCSRIRSRHARPANRRRAGRAGVDERSAARHRRRRVAMAPDSPLRTSHARRKAETAGPHLVDRWQPAPVSVPAAGTSAVAWSAVGWSAGGRSPADRPIDPLPASGGTGRYPARLGQPAGALRTGSSDPQGYPWGRPPAVDPAPEGPDWPVGLADGMRLVVEVHVGPAGVLQDPPGQTRRVRGARRVRGVRRVHRAQQVTAGPGHHPLPARPPPAAPPHALDAVWTPAPRSGSEPAVETRSGHRGRWDGPPALQLGTA